MENSLTFDLNRAIHDWRTGLCKCRAIKRDSLDELESHLRDSIVTLMAKELSEDEAFLIAVRRCGTQKQLKTEFLKSSFIESLIQVWFFRTAWIFVGLLALLNGYSLWRAVGAWDDHPALGLRLPDLMLVLLAITALNAFPLRHIAKARTQRAIFSVLYWPSILFFSGSLILASFVTFDLLSGAFLYPHATSPDSVTQGFSNGTGLSLEGFFLLQILILVLQLAVTGVSACFSKVFSRKSIAVSI